MLDDITDGNGADFVWRRDFATSEWAEVGLLMQTYPRYVDSASREAVQAVAKELVQRDETGKRRGVTEQIVGRIANEVSDIAKRSR